MADVELIADPDEAVRPALTLLPAEHRQFGRYVILSRFAAGGMANLFLALAPGPAGFSKLLAIKRIHEHLTSDSAFVHMLLDEARIAARISHPNVVQVIELGAVGGVYFIAMEYVAGASLGVLLQRGPLPVAMAARVIADAAAGLHAAHELRDSRGELLNVVHRDVSPENVLVTEDGSVKVTDFGVASARGNMSTTVAGAVKGKFAYMAPEQARAGQVDRRADIFSLGILLHESLTGRPLFKAESEMVTMAKVLREPIHGPSQDNPSCPPQLDEIVLRALARDRRKRFQTARELRVALEQFLAAGGHRTSVEEVAARVHAAAGERLDEVRALVQSYETRSLDDSAAPTDILAASPVLSGTSVSAAGLTPFSQRWVRYALAAGGIALVVALVVGVWSLIQRPSTPEAPRPAALGRVDGGTDVAGTVHILIRAIPAQANIRFDGREVSNPHDVQQPVTKRQVEAVLSAPGYATRRFMVPLSESGRWVIALDRLPVDGGVVSPGTAQPGEARSSPAPAVQPSNRRRRRGGKRLDSLLDNPYR